MTTRQVTKKVAKMAPKKAAKKPAKKTAKKTIRRPTAARLLAKINPEQYFVLCSGIHLKNVKELADSIDHMAQDVFRHHVNDSKNDFSNWVRGVFKDNSLADDLQKTQDMMGTQLTIYRHLVAQFMKSK